MIDTLSLKFLISYNFYLDMLKTFNAIFNSRHNFMIILHIYIWIYSDMHCMVHTNKRYFDIKVPDKLEFDMHAPL